MLVIILIKKPRLLKLCAEKFNAFQQIPKEKLIGMYKKMLEIRFFEEEVVDLLHKGELRCPFAPYIGEEAIAVGTCSNLREDDYITTTHRGHGHVIAKGATLKEVMAEIFGKRTGCCKGKVGSFHLCVFHKGMIGAYGVVGDGIPVATGVGLSIKLRNTDQVVACFFGDGATNTGAFHEGVNMAAIWKLPVIFICENNLYAISTPITKSTRVKNLADKMLAYGISAKIVDGNDVIDVYKSVNEAVIRARKGEGPIFLEFKTYLPRGHAEDPRFIQLIHAKEEIEKWKLKDPIERLKRRLLEAGVLTKYEDSRLRQVILKDVKDSVNFAIESPYADQNEARKGVFVRGE